VGVVANNEILYIVNKIKYLFIVHLLLGTTVFGQNLNSVDSFIERRMKEKHIPGLSIAIIEKGKVIHKEAYGYSVVEHKVPAKVETVYELASLSKQFIATGILLLEQDGLLDINQPISKYIDSLPEKWELLTLKQLLSHTAGLAPMESEWKSLKKDGWPKHVTREMLWESAIKDPIFYAPGEQFRYHNLGYSLSIFIIEKITKGDHRDFFKSRIFDPLGMDNTFFEDQTKVAPNQAEGYTLKNGELAKIWRVGQEDIGVGDGIYSSLEDMIKWNNAIRENRLLASDFQAKMFEKVILNNGQPFRYGLGWWLPERNGINYRYHNGITGPEYLSIPSEELEIIILSNLGQGDFDEVHHWGLADEIIGNFFLEEFRHPLITETKRMENPLFFVGTFEYEDGGELEIYFKNNGLHLRDSFGETLMIYIGDNTFILEDDPVIFRFLNSNRIQVEEEIWNDDFANRIR
jgi:CubicO group peptidase (beta-lactamase class C family)